MADDLLQLVIRQNMTDFTTVIHSKPYPSISPYRPELSQAGKTVLITGGASNIGYGIAKSFVQAGVSTVIITSRRQSVLETAAENLNIEAQRLGFSTSIHWRVNDQTDREAVRELWEGLKAAGIYVDTLVCNAGSFSGGKPILEQGSDVTWQAIETNVRGPLDMVEGFTKQPGDKPKVVLNITTQCINMMYEEQLVVTALNPGYPLSKNAGTLLLQLIAKDVSPDKLQIISFHPGAIHNETLDQLGYSKDKVPFDDKDLPGAYAVWAASKEARFLHGRFVWASWDVNELATGELRQKIDNNVDFLRIGVLGLRGAKKDSRGF